MRSNRESLCVGQRLGSWGGWLPLLLTGISCHQPGTGERRQSSGRLGRWEKIVVAEAACSQASAPGALPMGVAWSA